MTLAENLKTLRKRHKLTQEQLATIIGVERSSVGKYETGTMPSMEILTSISEHFGVTVDFLLGRTSPNTRNSPAAANILPLPETYEIPLLGDIACGTPILATENVEQTVTVPSHITADFCLRCKGDSMIGARIYDGDLVYIKQQDDVDDGQIAAVLVDDEATLKRVYRDGDSMILQAENPAIKPQIYTAKDAKNIRIIGLAVAFLSKVR